MCFITYTKKDNREFRCLYKNVCGRLCVCVYVCVCFLFVSIKSELNCNFA